MAGSGDLPLPVRRNPTALSILEFMDSSIFPSLCSITSIWLAGLTPSPEGAY